MAEQLIPLGNVAEADTLGNILHHAAIHGNKKALKKVLDKGIHIDYPNDEGQSPLFCACLCGNRSVVEYLMSAGADPNEKSNSGLTPVHAASYSAHVKILMKLLAEGGDLRLHDNQGRSVKDWAMLQPTPKKRMKMMEFLDKTRLFAMSSSGQDLLTRKASTKTMHRAHHRRNTVTDIIRNRIGRASVHNRLEQMATEQHTVGFGQVYSDGGEKAGFISAIPLVSENNLKHDPDGETFNNGAFCVMESMWWDYTEVTIKRLHRELDPYQGGVVDLLINEIQHIGKLRHPHILTLMGVCQTNNLDGLVVIYERIGQGSLYNCLHQEMERLPSQAITDIAVQMCNALIFIHLQGLVHCAVTSHAINVVAPNMYKLGNFEYMLEASKCELGKKNAVATNTSENAVYNWMGPEIMMNLPPSFYCDMYSYCAVIWEIFHGQVPWTGHCSESIKAQYHKGTKLPLANGQMPDYYKTVLEYGLQLDPNNRKLSCLHVRDILLASPKDMKQYMRTHFQHLHDNKHGTISNPDKHSTQPTAAPRQDMKQYMRTHFQHLHDNKHGTISNPDKHSSEPVAAPRQVVRSKQHKNMENTNRERGQSSGQQQPSDRERQRKRHRSQNEEENYIKSRNGYNDNCQQTRREETPLDGRQAVRQYKKKLWPDESLSDVNYEQRQRLNEEFENSRFTIESGKNRDDSYQYKIQMLKQSNQGQDSTQVKSSPMREQYKTAIQTSTESCLDEGVTTDNATQTASSDSQQYAKGRSLERKTSSMGKFSYMYLDNQTRPRCAGAKPACHVQSDLVAEEYSTAGKLTTAGSLYALYNDHSPDLPMGQLEHRNYHKFATLPKRAEPKPPSVEADPRWFGGQGSVRDLAKVFQHQIREHHAYQSVVDGTVNKNHSSEKNLNTGSTCKIDIYQTPEKYHRLTYDDDDASSSVTETSTSGQTDSKQCEESSTESDQISQWVDHELRKIKRNLSKELAVKESMNNAAMTKEAYDRPTNKSAAVADVYLDSSDSNTTQATDVSSNCLQAAGDKERYDQIETCYFDDEIYSDQDVGRTYRHMQPDLTDISTSPRQTGVAMSYRDEQPDLPDMSASPVRTSIPMSTVLRETPTKSQEKKQLKEPASKNSSGSARRRQSRIPMSKSSLSSLKVKDKDAAYANIVTIKSSLDDAGVHQDKDAAYANIVTIKSSLDDAGVHQDKDAAYANIVTIKSSLDDAGVHQVTHKMKNLKTGGSKTVFNEKVNAKKVVTTFRAAR